MSISGVSNTMASQFYQTSAQNSGSRVLQQPQQVQQQGPAEESRESAAIQRRENSTGGEARESKSIDFYA